MTARTAHSADRPDPDPAGRPEGAAALVRDPYAQVSEEQGTGSPRPEASEHDKAVSERDTAPRTAVVIGGGLAGTTAALALADAGVRVTLLEGRPRPAS